VLPARVPAVSNIDDPAVLGEIGDALAAAGFGTRGAAAKLAGTDRSARQSQCRLPRIS